MLSDTTRTQTRNQFRLKCLLIPLGHSDGHSISEWQTEIPRMARISLTVKINNRSMCILYTNGIVPVLLLPWGVETRRVKIKLFSREGKFFSWGSYFDIFPENVIYRKLLICVLNCYLAVICAKLTPSPILTLFQRGSTTAPGGQTLQPPLICALEWVILATNMEMRKLTGFSRKSDGIPSRCVKIQREFRYRITRDSSRFT